MGNKSLAEEFLRRKITKKEFDKIYHKELKYKNKSWEELGIELWKKLYEKIGEELWKNDADDRDIISWKYEYLKCWEMFYLFETQGDDKKQILDYTNNMLRECRSLSSEFRKSMLRCWMHAAYRSTGDKVPKLNPMAVLYDLMKGNYHYDEDDCKEVVESLIDRVTRTKENLERQRVLKEWVINCLNNGECAKPYQSKALSAVIQEGWGGETGRYGEGGKKNRAGKRRLFYWSMAFVIVLVFGLLIRVIGAGLSRIERPYSVPESMETYITEETQHMVERETKVLAESTAESKLSTDRLAAFVSQEGTSDQMGRKSGDKDGDRLLSGKTDEAVEKATAGGRDEEIEWPEELKYNPTKLAVLSAMTSYNLREEPDLGAAVLTKIPAGESVEIVAKAGDWSRVLFTDQHGIKYEGYVKFALP